MRSRRPRSGWNDVGSCWVASLPWAPHSRRAPRDSSSRGGSPPMSLALPSRSRRRWTSRRRPRRRRVGCPRRSARSSRRTTSSTASTPRCSCPRFVPRTGACGSTAWSIGRSRWTSTQLVGSRLIERDITLTCVSNEVGGPYVGNARWVGVPLKPLLEEAGVDPGADQLVSRSVDGFTVGTPRRGGDGRARRDARRRDERRTAARWNTGSRSAWSCPACTATSRRRSGSPDGADDLRRLRPLLGRSEAGREEARSRPSRGSTPRSRSPRWRRNGAIVAGVAWAQHRRDRTRRGPRRRRPVARGRARRPGHDRHLAPVGFAWDDATAGNHSVRCAPPTRAEAPRPPIGSLRSRTAPPVGTRSWSRSPDRGPPTSLPAS